MNYTHPWKDQVEELEKEAAAIAATGNRKGAVLKSARAIQILAGMENITEAARDSHAQRIVQGVDRGLAAYKAAKDLGTPAAMKALGRDSVGRRIKEEPRQGVKEPANRNAGLGRDSLGRRIKE